MRTLSRLSRVALASRASSAWFLGCLFLFLVAEGLREGRRLRMALGGPPWGLPRPRVPGRKTQTPILIAGPAEAPQFLWIASLASQQVHVGDVPLHFGAHVSATIERNLVPGLPLARPH